MNKTILWVVTLAFAVLTGFAIRDHGASGILLFQFQNLAGWQVLIDLAIALGLFVFWMWKDAKVVGRNPYPWLLITLVAGSFGPLLYLLTRKDKI